MGWILIIVGSVLLAFVAWNIAVVVWKWMFRKSGPAPSQELKAQVYQDQAVPGQGIVNNIKTRLQVGSDTKTQQVANLASYTATQGIEEQSRAIDATLRQHAIEDVHRRGAEKNDAEHDKELARLRTEKFAYETNQQEDELRRLIIAKAKAQGISLNILEKEELDRLDIEKLMAEARVKIEAAFIYQLREYQHLMMLRRELDGLYIEIDQIQNGPGSEELKRLRIAERTEDAEALRKDRHGRRQRLLQALNGDDNRESDEDTDD
jgi:hypothetical protein